MIGRWWKEKTSDRTKKLFWISYQFKIQFLCIVHTWFGKHYHKYRKHCWLVSQNITTGFEAGNRQTAVAQNFPLPVSHPTAIPVSKKKKSYTATVMATSPRACPMQQLLPPRAPHRGRGRFQCFLLLWLLLLLISIHSLNQCDPSNKQTHKFMKCFFKDPVMTAYINK
jgi:hypothetical protein